MSISPDEITFYWTRWLLKVSAKFSYSWELTDDVDMLPEVGPDVRHVPDEAEGVAAVDANVVRIDVRLVRERVSMRKRSQEHFHADYEVLYGNIFKQV